MSLADDLSHAFHAVSLEALPAPVVAHGRTLLLDALACILGGGEAEVVALARRRALRAGIEPGGASLLPDGPRVAPAEAALANGARLRSLDFMDVYVDADVSHPSESVPAALACAEAAGASGRAVLETLLAAFALHAQLASTLALHRNGLHHVGHAAWVVPLVAGRLLGLGPDATARALALSAGGLFVPEGFSRGQVANVKALAFPLLARRAIELAQMAGEGLAAQPRACEETLALLGRLFGHEIPPAALLPPRDCAAVTGITLKAYPAQYALQPLIAAGAAFHRQAPERVGRIDSVLVRAGRQTVARTADAAKFQPASREAADHSLPFCVAAGLLDGGLTAAALQGGRWKDPEILALTARTRVEAVGDDEGFAIGRQEILLRFADGTTAALDCSFPPQDRSWRQIAIEKLTLFADGRLDVSAVVELVEGLEHLDSVAPLLAALRQP